MLPRLFATDDSVATAVLGPVLGVVFFAPGAQKMLGWFGGWFLGNGGLPYRTDAYIRPAPFLAIAPSCSAGRG